MIPWPTRVLAGLVRFGLELAALAAVGAWGWQAGSNAGSRVLLCVAGPSAIAIVWGQFIAPRAPRRPRRPWRVAVEIGVFTTATVALGALGLANLAAAFAVLAGVNTLLIHSWREGEPARLGAVAGAPTRTTVTHENR